MQSVAQKINNKIYYGWVMVAVSGLGLFFSAPGQTYSISVFINAWRSEFGYSASLMSAGYMAATILSGSLLVVMGKMVDRFGQRTMMMVVGIMLAFSAFYNSYVMNIGMIFFGFFLLRYFGQGSMTLIPHSLVPQWFEKKRAFAMSLENIGGLIATLSVPTINYFMITTFGWQMAFRFWGIALVVIFVPVVFFTVINRPEDINMQIDGENNGVDAAKEALEKMNHESFSLKEALKTKAFWLIGGMSIIVPMFSTGVTFHFFEMMGQRNLSENNAAFIIGMLAFPAFFMPFVAKILIDKYPPKYIFFTTLIMIFLSMIYLAFFVSGFISAMLFILFYGTAVAIQVVTLNIIWPTYFGRKYLGSIRGAAQVFMVVSTAVGPLPLGLSFDVTGSFNYAIYLMMGLTIISMIFSISIQKPKKAY